MSENPFFDEIRARMEQVPPVVRETSAFPGLRFPKFGGPEIGLTTDASFSVADDFAIPEELEVGVGRVLTQGFIVTYDWGSNDRRQVELTAALKGSQGDTFIVGASEYAATARKLGRVWKLWHNPWLFVDGKVRIVQDTQRGGVPLSIKVTYDRDGKEVFDAFETRKLTAQDQAREKLDRSAWLRQPQYRDYLQQHPDFREKIVGAADDQAEQSVSVDVPLDLQVKFIEDFQQAQVDMDKTAAFFKEYKSQFSLLGEMRGMGQAAWVRDLVSKR
jgi:hypothetical protein